MSIKITLEGSETDELVLHLAGNERVLLQSDNARFPLLSQLDMCSYDVFAQVDMDALLAELAMLSPESGAMAEHVAEIQRLAEKARTTPGATLSFTPFD